MSKLVRNAKYLGSDTGIVVLKRNVSTPQHWQVKCGGNNHVFENRNKSTFCHYSRMSSTIVQMVLSWNVGD